MMDAATGPSFAITAVEEEEPDYGLIIVDEEHPVDHDEIPGPPSQQSNNSERDAISTSRRVGTAVSRFLTNSIGNSNSNTGLQKSTSSETKKTSLSNSVNPKMHRRFISAPHLKQLEAKGASSPKDEMDLSDTEHRWSGQGILASRADLDLPFDQFAAGCNLLQAAAKGDLDQVKSILALGKTHVNFRDYDRRTALHVAASEGHLNVCQYIVEQRGARINRSDRWGGSPLDDAHRHRRSEIIQFLRKHGATTGSGNRSINLIAAAAEGDVDEVKTLLQIGGSQQKLKLDIDKGDYDKRTALHLAAGEGHVEIVRLLCEAGADVNVEDRWSRRPLDDALSASHMECVSVLESFGAARGNMRPAPEGDMDNSDRRVVDNMEVNFDELDLIDRIGSGAFGEIYKCRWRGTLVAAKIIKSSKIRNDWLNKRMLDQIKQGNDVSTCIKEMDDADRDLDQSEKDEAIADFRREISVLKSLRHPHIVLLLAYSTTANYECLISELMKCSLLDVFKSHIVQGTKMHHRQQIAYATQLALGMNYLHTCKPPIVHRDLKPANLLIDHSGILKISDFGLSKIRPDPSKKETEKYVMTGETGSYRFMAPECFRHEEYNETVDVYSFAMILFYLLVGRPPWPNLSGIDAVKRASEDGDRPNIPRDMDVRMSNMLKECWNENPSLRPSFEQIVDSFYEYNKHVFKLKSSDTVYSTNDAAAHCCAIL